MGVKEEVVQKKRLDILLYYFFSFQKKKIKSNPYPVLL